jgi:hypothetical protein
MVTKPTAVIGSTFQWNTITVGRLATVGEPGETLETKSVLLHDSPSYRPEVIPLSWKPEKIKLSGEFDPSDAGQVALMTDATAGTRRAWIRSASDSSWTWSGYGYCVSAGPKKDSVKDTNEFEAEIEVDGVPTYSATASAGLTTPFFTVTGTGGGATITPAAAQTTYAYNVSLVAGSTSYYITPTATAGVITVIDNSGNEQTVLTGANSTSITAPTNSMHTVYIQVKETGKVAKRYTLHVGEPV